MTCKVTLTVVLLSALMGTAREIKCAVNQPSAALIIPKGFMINQIELYKDSTCKTQEYVSVSECPLNKQTISVPLKGCTYIQVTLAVLGVAPVYLWKSSVEKGRTYTIDRRAAKATIIAQLKGQINQIQLELQYLRGLTGAQLQVTLLNNQIVDLQNQITQINNLYQIE